MGVISIRPHQVVWYIDGGRIGPSGYVPCCPPSSRPVADFRGTASLPAGTGKSTDVDLTDVSKLRT